MKVHDHSPSFTTILRVCLKIGDSQDPSDFQYPNSIQRIFPTAQERLAISPTDLAPGVGTRMALEEEFDIELPDEEMALGGQTSPASGRGSLLGMGQLWNQLLILAGTGVVGGNQGRFGGCFWTVRPGRQGPIHFSGAVIPIFALISVLAIQQVWAATAYCNYGLGSCKFQNLVS